MNMDSMDGMSGMGDMGGMGGMDGMGGMGGSQPDSHACKVSMLWNWDTIDTCFIADSWHIHSQGAFAGFCIGVIILVIFLEFLRYAGRQYDQYLINQHQKYQGVQPDVPMTPFRPSILQHAIRALLHTLAFATAYLLMLLAMYFNGYIIISIIIGAFIGYFVFHWERLDFQSVGAASSSKDNGVSGCCH
ncbi:Ctr copper transporter family-domain-containing protein [Nemania abortiva]|nr:Ctr copper transporter family-domain-containing protein [Nemania abortiva]